MSNLNPEKKLSYYRNLILNNMATFETRTNKLFHEDFEDLASQFHAASDEGNVRKLMFINNQLNKMIDEVN